MSFYNEPLGILGAEIQIMVEKKDFENALKLISQPATESAIQCPVCKSTNISFGVGSDKIKKYLLIALSLLIVIPIGNLKVNYQCENCQYNF